MKFWQLISDINWNKDVNHEYGEGQWAIQECWVRYLQIWVEKAEDVKGWDRGREGAV